MRWHWLVAMSFLAVVLVPGGSTAAPGKEPIKVHVQSSATLVDQGSVQVNVRIRCAPFGEAFESNITVTQDDGAVFAQPGLGTPTCDDRWHTTTVVATPFDGAFHRGHAFASAFVSRIDPVTGETVQGQDVRNITVR